MPVYRPGSDRYRDQAIADQVDPTRWIALRPIRTIGRLAFYWSIGKVDRPDTVHVYRGSVVSMPRLRWLPSTLINV